MINNKISEIIKARKSIFPSQFNGKEIDKETIMELLKNANTAPSHKLTQPWFFKVFSRSSKTRLAKELIKQNTKKEDKLLLKFQKSSHIICICMRRDKTKSIPEWEEIAATAMAVQNIWLSCVDSKIGGYWSTPKGIEKLNKFLNLKKNEKCLGLFYVGIYELIKKRKLTRKNIETETEWFD
ncbi:MAG: nitroreductase [Flavobacteriales bacterium]|nr:nitroreductase [Flavobacteriales bacterium]|tara:strand:- start:352 stop:897 length:546 start_codon:yes stop_codon:yes gene_type:complete